MRGSIICRICLSAALVLGTAALASASTCSYVGVAGEWGYTFSGTLFLPTGPVLFAGVGRYTLDQAGNFSGTQTSSRGGVISQDVLNGTATVNPDCTGILTVDIFDQSGTLLRTAVWAMVYVDKATEIRSILTSLVLKPSGTIVPAVVTDTTKRLSPGQ